MEQYLKDALKIYELSNNLENITIDDRKKIEDITLNEVIEEAKYLLKCYYESGHILNEDLLGYEGREAQKEAEKTVKQLKKFIKKYS
jgi:hypothetical protein